MGKLKGIFENFGKEYIQTYPNIPKNHQKVIQAIMDCRSGNLGKTIYQCQACGKFHVVNQSCGNRHCPVCQYQKSQKWLHKQQERMLPGPHFMITFTVPEELRPFLRSHQSAGYSALFKASSEALKRLARNEKFIGTDLPGFTGILHTWGRQLNYHPHIHYVVPGGGLSLDRSSWIPSHPEFFLPIKALSPIYRALFKEQMAKNSLLEAIDPIVWSIDWNVNSQAVGDGKVCLTYLAPYVFKVAIGESRIASIENRVVTFTYKKHDSNRIRTMSLDVLEFIRRFLQHVLPSGFMKVRHYGFMHHSCKIPIRDIRTFVHQQSQTEGQETETFTDVKAEQLYCPDCGGLLELVSVMISLRSEFCDSS